MRTSLIALVSVVAMVLTCALSSGPAWAAAKAPDKTASLTVRQDGGWSAQNSTIFIPIDASSSQEGLSPANQYLADSSGLDKATVSISESARSCGGATRYTSLGTHRLCLEIAGIRAGSDVTGSVLTTSGETFELTVSVRDGLARPILVALGSLLLGGFLTWLTTDKIPSNLGGKPADSAVTPSDAEKKRAAEWKGITIGAVIVTGTIAAATALSTVYGGNDSFGSLWDYIALATAALGSSVLSGIVTSILLIVGKKPPATA